MKFDIVLEKQAEGGYTAYVPKLPGCISEGETRAEALNNIREAISIYGEEIKRGKMKQLLSCISLAKVEVKAYA